MGEQQISDEPFKVFLTERYYDIMFVEPEDEALKCVKCQDVAILPTLTSCGHTLCKECQNKLMKRTIQTCPKCDSAIVAKLSEVPQLVNLKNRIDALVIKCLNHKSGCKYEDQLKEMEAHMKTCQKLIQDDLPKLIELKNGSENEMVLELNPELSQNENNDTEITFTDSEINFNSPKELNILLLGQTGAGKSTFINALANYLKYENFENAEKSDLEFKIPCRFTIYDEKNKSQTINLGSDSNEQFQTGESCTQNSKSYDFHHKGQTIRIFDTPGVGDTRGIEQDKVNLENILAVLSKFEHLHSICILLKPNESRITATFEYSIKQMMCQLQKNAINNIVFVLTHTRSTYYSPGDTLASLKEVFKRIKSVPPHVSVPITKDNVFCLDNEAFKFLVAVKNGVTISSDHRDDYEKSWKTSGANCIKLIQYIINNCSETPCNIKETLCINHVRKAIIDLSNPLVQTAQNIQDNLQVLKQQIENIENHKSDEKKLKELLYIPIIKMKFNELDAPRTVCQSEKCAKKYIVCQLSRNHYPQICCDPCACERVQQNNGTDNENIRFCKAFHKKTGNCLKCKCLFSQHKQIYYESFIEEEKLMDESTVKKLKSNAMEAAEIVIASLKVKENKYKNEEELMTKNTAKLSIFLKKNAILSYNDAFETYLQQQIENEKLRTDSNKPGVIRGLEEMKMKYMKEKELVEKFVDDRQDEIAVSTEEVLRIIEELYAMEMSGKVLKVAAKMQVMESEKLGWFSLLATVTAATTGVAGISGAIAALTIAPPLLIPAAIAASASAGTGVFAYFYNKVFKK